MGVVTGIAIYFVIWWTVLFIVLPIGMRSQIDEDDVILGTAHSAPAKFSLRRVVARTTILATSVFLSFYVATEVLGLGLDNFPRIVPGT